MRRFSGSPTILIDGWDPFARPGGEPALACRVYRHGNALPDARQLRQALKRVAAEGVASEAARMRSSNRACVPGAAVISTRLRAFWIRP